MRVTFIAPVADLSGGFRVIVALAERLRRRGHAVTLVTAPPRRPTLRERARSVLHRRPLPSAARRGPSHADGAAFEHRVVARHGPIESADVPDGDVVIATWWETAEWIADYPTSKGARAHFLQHFEAFPGQPAERVAATWRLPMHKIVSSRWLADLARDRFGDDEVSVVPSSVDLATFHAPPRGKQPVPTVGMVYSTAAFKGCDISLRAVDLAAGAVSGLRLVCFGCSPPSPGLPLPPGATFCRQPVQARLRELYAACDAWLFGSRAEGFGLPLLEAMACRTPVIATPAGAAPELLTAGGGVLVPPEDPAAMAAAIEHVCAMPQDEWRATSDRAYAVASRYTWDDAAERFEAALQRAVRRAGRPASPALGRVQAPTPAAAAAPQEGRECTTC